MSEKKSEFEWKFANIDTLLDLLTTLGNEIDEDSKFFAIIRGADAFLNLTDDDWRRRFLISAKTLERWRTGEFPPQASLRNDIYAWLTAHIADINAQKRANDLVKETSSSVIPAAKDRFFAPTFAILLNGQEKFWNECDGCWQMMTTDLGDIGYDDLDACQNVVKKLRQADWHVTCVEIRVSVNLPKEDKKHEPQ